MVKDDLSDLFEQALDKGDGEFIWRALEPDWPSASGEGPSLFNDPHFVKELERFIEKNRLSIATAHTRHQLRLALSRLKEKVRQKPVRHFQIPSI
jgi:hypothetical protein